MMEQCKGKTKSGERCKMTGKLYNGYCYRHKDQSEEAETKDATTDAKTTIIPEQQKSSETSVLSSEKASINEDVSRRIIEEPPADNQAQDDHPSPSSFDSEIYNGNLSISSFTIVIILAVLFFILFFILKRKKTV